MGWTYSHKPQGQSIADYMTTSGPLAWRDSDEATHRHTVLETALIGLKTFYAAVERVNKATNEREVWAAVVLINYDNTSHYNFGYKGMSEHEGPCEDDCPERILKLLTPIESKYANEWRDRCWKKINDRKARPKIEPGCTLIYGGKEYRVLEPLGRKGYSVSSEGRVYRMTMAQVRQVTEVRVPQAAQATQAALTL